MPRGTICRAFVGRAPELADLQQWYRTAAAGRGCVVLVSGEAGVGKTRLLAEFARAIKSEHPRIATGYAHEGAQAPYAPFLEALGRLPAPTSARWARRSPLLDDGTSGSTQRGEEQAERLRRFVATSEMLAEAAATRPIVLVLEDIHWADFATLDLLAYLARSLRAARVLVVATHRSEEPGRFAHYSRLTAIGREAAGRIELQPLGSAEMQHLFSTVIAHRRVVSVSTLKRIEELTEGRPFIAEELLRSVLDSKAAHSAAVPVSLKASILERTELLERSERDMLAYAAVIGRTFDAVFLSELVAWPLERVLDVLRRARDLQLIVEEPGGDATFAFRHALTREVLYGELLTAQVRALHARIVARLESQSEVPLGVLAYHSWAARDAAKAMKYNALAGKEAAALLAHGDAARFFERALEFGEPVLETAPLFEDLSRARYMSGDVEGARDACERALALHAGEAQPEKAIGLLVEVARLEYALGNVLRAREMAGRALELHTAMPAGPERLLVYFQLASIEVHSGRAREALELLAAAEPDELRDAPAALCRYYGLRAYARCSLGELGSALDDYERALAAGEASGDATMLLRTKNNVASRLSLIGDLERSERLYRESLELAQATRNARVAPLLAYSCASVLLTRGRLADARAMLEDGLELGVGAITERVAASATAIRLGLLELDDELVSVHANEDLIELAFRSDESQNIGNIAGTFVALFRERGRHDDAAALRRRAIAAIHTTDFAYWLIDAVALAGDEAETARARTLLERSAASPQDRIAAAYLALFRARLEGRAGAAGVARAAANEAADRFGAIGCPLETAWALEAAGRPREALAIYRGLGAAREERRLAATLPDERRVTGERLTRREGQIAALVADGKSNREIAEQLTISERTVEAHLASAFARMGVRTRLELATRILAKNTP